MSRKIKLDPQAETKLLSSSTWGYGKWRCSPGDFITYKEPLTDGSVNLRAARVIGRITECDNDGPSGVGMLCVLAINEDLHFGYERWVDPKDVTGCMDAKHAGAFLTWLIWKLFKRKPKRPAGS